jgi:hypothetical protein
MANRVSVEEMELLEGCKSGNEYTSRHIKKFPQFYKDTPLTGAKRAENIYGRRDEYLAIVEKQKHTIVVPTKTITASISSGGKRDPLPDNAEILVKILNELRIQTKQYDELLAIARAPKNHFTPATAPYTGGIASPTKQFGETTAAQAITSAGDKSANK